MGVVSGSPLVATLSAAIVSFTPDHYSALTALWNQAYPDLRRTELELRLADLATAPVGPRRWLAQRQGTVVGFASYEDLEGELFRPHTYQLHLFVSPENRRQGIGARLYEQVISDMKLLEPELVRCWVLQVNEDSVRFLGRRGFSEEMRTFHSSLDTGQFDLKRLERYVGRLEKYGYEFRTFVDLAADPERNRKTYEVYREVMNDIPSPEPPQLPSLAEYEERIAKSPEFFRAQFIALHHGEYVGLCILLPKGRDRRELYADTLGVTRSFRGRGIAQALSYSGIDFAKRNGYMRISADSFVENRKILSLLENLGFADARVWTLFAKSF